MTNIIVSRSITIAAPAATVQPQIADLHLWEAWSPWQEIDPNMEQHYTAADRGVGAQMHWKGNKEAGEGSMTVVTAEPQLIEIDIAFIKPFKATNRSIFTLSEHDGSTKVNWSMTGEQGAFMRFLFKVMKMEQRIGADFERGLARLKATVEAETSLPSDTDPA